MNLSHLKYVLEVAKTGSISQAAENLYMSQPNLSKAVREFEDSIGFSVFKRTTKGIEPTKKGVEFLEYARHIMAEIEEMEEIYGKGPSDKQTLSVCVPRASYISQAFAEYIGSLDASRGIDVSYFETGSMNAINNIIDESFSLGIIRCKADYEKNFYTLLEEKKIRHDILFEYRCRLLLSKTHPLAQRDDITLPELYSYIEIKHGDTFVPFLPPVAGKDRDKKETVKKRIYVYERGGQFDLLRSVPGAFMWVSPMPGKILDAYGLVEKKCAESKNVYKDILIYTDSHRFTDTEKGFLSSVRRVIEEVK